MSDPGRKEKETEPINRDLIRNPQTIADTDEIFIRRTLSETPEKGMELLFLRYYQPLCTHAIKFVRSRETAEDIVSEIFYHFYSKRIYLSIETSYRAYLFRAVRNRGYNYLRWQLGKNGSLDEINPDQIPDQHQPDHLTHYEELYQDVENAIASLPVQRRSIYLSFQFEGKSIKEIASELSVSARTIETQIYRARQAVRALIREKWSFVLGMLLTHL